MSDAPPPRYRAFISYSHRDEAFVRWLHKGLETYRVPKALVGQPGDHGPVPRRLAPVFRDEDELGGAAELSGELEEALVASAALVVICSCAAAGSVWVDREIRRFKTLHPERPVLAVIVDGSPDGDRQCFPESLRFHVDPLTGELDRARSNEPLAPDLQKTDRQTVKLKLIAGLLGVGYGDLVRRDLRRARRQMAAFGSLGLAVIAALSVLSLATLTFARLAVQQRDRARVAEVQARKNAKAAEDRAWAALQAADTVRAMVAEGAGPCPPALRVSRRKATGG